MRDYILRYGRFYELRFAGQGDAALVQGAKRVALDRSGAVVTIDPMDWFELAPEEPAAALVVGEQSFSVTIQLPPGG